MFCTAFRPSSTAFSLVVHFPRIARTERLSFLAISATKSYLCSRWSTMVQSRQIVFWHVWQKSLTNSPPCFSQNAGLTRAFQPTLLTSSRDKILWPLNALILLCAVTQNSHMKTQQLVQRDTAGSPLSQCSHTGVFLDEDMLLSCMLSRVIQLFTQKFGCSLPTSPSVI